MKQLRTRKQDQPSRCSHIAPFALSLFLRGSLFRGCGWHSKRAASATAPDDVGQALP
ncbi:MAG TPA: hypothetical protein VFV38_15490 [Ktedonobacteraceae bacterium]|nr:hypothetical protein [Ktedonobacteraceae bacterium]